MPQRITQQGLINYYINLVYLILFSQYFVMKPWCCFPCSIISLYILHFKNCTINITVFIMYFFRYLYSYYFLIIFLNLITIILQEVLHAYPQIIVDPLDTGVVRVRLSGDAYNRKTLNRVKKSLPKPQVRVSLENWDPILHCSLFLFLHELLNICTQLTVASSTVVVIFSSISVSLLLVSGYHWNHFIKKMPRCCKTLGRIVTDGQLGVGRGRWLQLPLKHLPQVSKPAPLPSYMQRNVVNIFFLDWSFKKLPLSYYNCVCVSVCFFRTLNSQLIHTESTVSTTPCITINTIPSYSARRR